MQFTLYKQKPVPRKTGVSGYVNGDSKAAHFFGKGDNLIATLEKPEIKFVSIDSMMLRGYEPNGYTVNGVQKLTYQEWLLRVE